MFRPWAGVLLRHARPQAGERVLDVACGTGVVAREVAPQIGPGGQVTAVDMNPGMLAVARGLPLPSGLPILWQEGNASALPFADGAFDLVLCQHGLQFFPDRAGAVREMHRVLRPGGRATVIVLQTLSLHPVFEALMESVASKLSLPMSAVATPFSLSDARELRALFDGAGFKTVDVHPESITVQFPEPQRFVPLAVMSSAAAIPSFAALEGPERAALVGAVGADIESTLQKVRQGGALTFPMFANVAVATA